MFQKFKKCHDIQIQFNQFKSLFFLKCIEMMKPFAEEVKKNTEGKSEEYFNNEENKFKLTLRTVQDKLKEMYQKQAALRDEVEARRKECLTLKKQLDSQVSIVEKIQSEYKIFYEKTQKKGAELALRRRLVKDEEVRTIRLGYNLKSLEMVIQNDRMYLISGIVPAEEVKRVHLQRSKSAGVQQAKLKELEENVNREQSSIQVDEVRLNKDQGQFEVYQRQIQKEQQEKESMEISLMESTKELNKKRSSLFEINQQLKSEHGKKFELDIYLSTLKYWHYWVQVKAREKQVFDNLENDAMLKEETTSEDEAEAQCHSPKRSR